jgi:hypothetical protein
MSAQPLTIDQQPASPPRVVRVREGPRGADGTRIFSVALSAVLQGDDVSLVATAEDAATKLRIPAAGEPHPTIEGLAARPPQIFAVGVRDARWGIMLATRSRFYNVRVRYNPKSEMGGV